MGRLHDPGPGEILDRLTILALKIVHGRQAGRDTKHWEEERAALAKLLTTCQAKCIAGGGKILELAAVNAALWQAEDEIRQLRAGVDLPGDPIPWLRRVQYCAFNIQSLNDRRAELITLINVNRPSDKV